MFIGFNLQIDENASIFNGLDYKKWQEIGENHLNNQKAKFLKKLEYYITKNEIDGTKIQDEWFPEIEADIFISHSGKDNELANALAGWIYNTFKLKCFIDSNVWGYSKILLELMNSSLSNKKKYQNGYLYDYESCNKVSQHVNTMLSIALQKMIDKAEAVILLNTGNVVKVCDYDHMEKTYSPWIYSEIICTQIIRKKPLLAYRKYDLRHKAFSVNESVKLLNNFDISYSVSLKHLKLLSVDDLIYWKREYNLNKYKYDYELDALYDIMCPDELESTKEMFTILDDRDVDALQHSYFASDMELEESEILHSVWKRIIQKVVLCCEHCDRFNDI